VRSHENVVFKIKLHNCGRSQLTLSVEDILRHDTNRHSLRRSLFDKVIIVEFHLKKSKATHTCPDEAQRRKEVEKTSRFINAVAFRWV
jgi:hypothetical protein